MRRAFLDTSYLLALLLQKDQHHDAAMRSQQAYAGQLLTTEYVLVELYDALGQRTLRPLATAVAEQLLNDRNVRLLPASTDLLARGRQVFRDRADKEWSLTDCVSFVVMAEEGLKEALSFDHHFQQAGFQIITP